MGETEDRDTFEHRENVLWEDFPNQEDAEDPVEDLQSCFCDGLVFV